MSLLTRRAWAPYAAAGVGTWLLFAPIALWAREPGAYLNDTLVGAAVIGLAVLIPHGMDMDGGDVPPGWSYNPSTWTQRLPIIGSPSSGSSPPGTWRRTSSTTSPARSTSQR